MDLPPVPDRQSCNPCNHDHVERNEEHVERFPVITTPHPGGADFGADDAGRVSHGVSRGSSLRVVME
jgi:hypothetical protein